MRLKNASTRFIREIIAAMDRKLKKNCPGRLVLNAGRNRTISPKITANEILARGPAAPTNAGPHF